MYYSVDYWTTTNYVDGDWSSATAVPGVYLIYGSCILRRKMPRRLKLHRYALLVRRTCPVKLGRLVFPSALVTREGDRGTAGPSMRIRIFRGGPVLIRNDIGVLGVRSCIPANFLRIMRHVTMLTDLLNRFSRRMLTYALTCTPVVWVLLTNRSNELWANDVLVLPVVNRR